MRALFLVLLLAGCARDSTVGLEAKLGALVGRPVTELAARMVWPEGDGWFSRWGSGEARNLVCDITFTSRDGRVTGYRYAGEACGWGGLPGLLP